MSLLQNTDIGKIRHFSEYLALTYHKILKLEPEPPGSFLSSDQACCWFSPSPLAVSLFTWNEEAGSPRITMVNQWRQGTLDTPKEKREASYLYFSRSFCIPT